LDLQIKLDLVFGPVAMITDVKTTGMNKGKRPAITADLCINLHAFF